MIFDLTQGKRPSNGWVHFKCPICPTRGMGPDPGAHLGIHTTSRGVHCWRCGARELAPSLHQVVGWGYQPCTSRELKDVPPKHSWKRLPAGCHASPWANHQPESQGGEWVETPRGPAVLMPFDETDGYQIRYTDGESPKVRNFGVKGPAWVRKEKGWSHLIIVEGWADGFAFNACVPVLALLGVDNYARVIEKVGNYVVCLALDNDKAGEGTRDRLTRLLLARHLPVWWARYRGKDPAAARSLIQWVNIRSLTDMRNFDACEDHETE